MIKISAISICVVLGLSACQMKHPAETNQFVFLGESNATGEEAAGAANLIVRNANAEGCRGISVGGYSTSLLFDSRDLIGQIVYGVPVMISCPPGVELIPTGQRAP